jgi:hypothetical protein
MAAPQQRRCEVHGGIPRLETRGVGAAEEEEAYEQQRNGPSHRRSDDDDRPHRCDEVPCRETRPPPIAIDEGGTRHRKEGSANYRGALRETRCADARDFCSQQRSHRRANRDPDTTDDLGDE